MAVSGVCGLLYLGALDITHPIIGGLIIATLVGVVSWGTALVLLLPALWIYRFFRRMGWDWKHLVWLGIKSLIEIVCAAWCVGVLWAVVFVAWWIASVIIPAAMGGSRHVDEGNFFRHLALGLPVAVIVFLGLSVLHYGLEELGLAAYHALRTWAKNRPIPVVVEEAPPAHAH